MKISSTELIIVYSFEGDLLQFSQSTFEHTTLKMSILDKDVERSTGETTIELEDFKELEDCIKDFKTKFNKLK